MLNDQVSYHGIFRKTIIAFGHLFSNVRFDRKQGDSVNGATVQRIHVPISYAPKEKWLVRIEQDPNLENNTYMSLPRMSFEITGYNYDASRKVGKMHKLVCNTDTESKTVFTPVPYNISVTMYVITKTQEDAMQIIEQILPTFTPDYTMAINAVPEMNIVQDVPISLDSISVQDEYDGDFQTRRFVTHTLEFTIKVNLFGPVVVSKPIYEVAAAVDTSGTGVPTTTYNTTGDPNTYNVIDNGWDGL